MAFAGLAGGCAAVAGLLLAGRMAGPPLSAGPMLQNATPDGFTLVWWQNGGGEDELRVRGGTAPDAVFPAIRIGARYEARARGLAPGTAYRYEILRRGANPEPDRLAAGQARSAKLPGEPFSFLVFSDSGGGRRPQLRLAQAMDQYPSDLILHCGDLIHGNGPRGDYAGRFFLPNQTLLRKIPFYPVLGNHDLREDNGRGFLDQFSLPTNGPPAVPPGRCYWFDDGDARFVGIDSTLDRKTLSDAVAPWLRDILRPADRRWKFAYFHHSPWEGGERPANEKICAALVPAIEESGTDVVFGGHNHLYQRTRPMRAGRIAPSNGTLYVTSGAGGRSLDMETYGKSPCLAAFDDSQFSFTWIRVSGGRVEIEQIGEHDDVLDRVVLSRPMAGPNRILRCARLECNGT